MYESLGYAGDVTLNLRSELRLRERGFNPGDLIDRFRQLPDPPLTGWFSLSEMKQSAEDIIVNGWSYEEFESVHVDKSPDWARYGGINRSWGYNLHTWKFIEPLLREHDQTNERYWLDKAISIVTNWIETYREQDAPEDPMVWYDMAVALRTPMLLHLLIRSSRHTDLRAQASVLAECLLWHVDKLHEDAAFNPNNNHGFYTAASQLHLAKFGAAIPGAGAIHAEGLQRLGIMADRQFAEDGVHLEHSPDYHRMLLGSFERAFQDGLISDEVIGNRIRRASHVLGWMIQPDGRLVQFGDSPSTQMVLKSASSLDPETLFLVRNGSQGTPPTSEVAVFKDGGYAFVRSPSPKTAEEIRECGYLAFSASFHSRAHKHADDLNVVWYDKGAEILVDAGRYGYGELLPNNSPLRRKGFYYASEARQYIEGTTAHNTLMMDGLDQERRNRSPYGSGIVGGSHEDGIFDLEGRVHHLDYIHRRRIVYTPGLELLIKDSVFSQTPEVRDAVIWFNIDGKFELVESEGGLVFERLSDGGVLRLEVAGPGAAIEPVRGQDAPMRGWRSRQDRILEPAWTFGFSFQVETRASVDTLFKLS